MENELTGIRCTLLLPSSRIAHRKGPLFIVPQNPARKPDSKRVRHQENSKTRPDTEQTRTDQTSETSPARPASETSKTSETSPVRQARI